MDAPRRTRQCDLSKPRRPRASCRGANQICLPLSQAEYQRIWEDTDQVRQWIDDLLLQFPELFPQAMRGGQYWLDGYERESRKMPGIRLRRIRIPGTNQVYTLRPSFVLPSMAGHVEEVEKGLYLLSWGVSAEAVVFCFGKDVMYWQRLALRLGNCSLAGTTVRDPSCLPQHLAADEHHTTVQGQKVYTSVTAAEGVFLGLALSAAADEQALTESYDDFRQEAQNVDPDYAPQTVNTDGWMATRAAWRKLFPTVALIWCFLHGFLKIRDRSSRKHGELRRRVWEVYRAPTQEAFLAALEELGVWSAAQKLSASLQEYVDKLIRLGPEYAAAYEHPDCCRTSSSIDRRLNLLNRVVVAGRRLHGSLDAAERRLRGVALLINFRPFTQRHRRPQRNCPWSSPAHRLNRRVYHDHWLHNLYVSASLGGFRK